MMMRAITSWAAVGLLVGLTCGQARADNPRVHLTLENVTAEEAVAALSKSARAPIQILSGRERDPVLQQRFSFDWSEARLSTALRQLMQRYQLQTESGIGNRYLLRPNQAPRPPLDYKGLVEKNGVRVYLRSISVSTSRTVRFDGQQGGDSGNMSVTFGVEVPDGEPTAIRGLESIIAKDDQGNILTFDQPNVTTPNFGFNNRLPDEWFGAALLPPPHQKARKLAWIEGEITAYKSYQKQELVLLPGDKGKPRDFGGVTVELARFDESPSLNVARENAKDLNLEVRVNVPPGNEFELDRTDPVMVVGASGKLFPAGGRSSSSVGDANGTRTRMTVQIAGVDEPISGVIVVTVRRSGLQRLISFRMTDIPLPEEAPVVRPRAAAVAPAPGRNAPVRKPAFAFQQVDAGGSLVTNVNVGGRPVPPGSLSLGLSAKEGDGWGPIRWTDADVGAGGEARLEHIKPGTYRVMRVFHTNKEVLPLKPGGHWVNAEVVVTVTAGKEVQVPPLMWATPPAAAPKR